MRYQRAGFQSGERINARTAYLTFSLNDCVQEKGGSGGERERGGRNPCIKPHPWHRVRHARPESSTEEPPLWHGNAVCTAEQGARPFTRLQTALLAADPSR